MNDNNVNAQRHFQFLLSLLQLEYVWVSSAADCFVLVTETYEYCATKWFECNCECWNDKRQPPPSTTISVVVASLCTGGTGAAGKIIGHVVVCSCARHKWPQRTTKDGELKDHCSAFWYVLYTIVWNATTYQTEIHCICVWRTYNVYLRWFRSAERCVYTECLAWDWNNIFLSLLGMCSNAYRTTCNYSYAMGPSWENASQNAVLEKCLSETQICTRNVNRSLNAQATWSHKRLAINAINSTTEPTMCESVVFIFDFTQPFTVCKVRTKVNAEREPERPMGELAGIKA